MSKVELLIFHPKIEKLSFPPSRVGKNPVLPYYDFLPSESLLSFTQNPSLPTLLVAKCGRFFSPQQAVLCVAKLSVLQVNSILILSTCRWPQVPQVKCSVPQDWDPTPLHTPQTPVAKSCASDPMAAHQRFPWPPPQVGLICQSGSQNPGKHLLLFTSLLKDMTKDTDEETLRAKSGRILSTGASVPWSWGCVTLLVCMPGSSPNLILLGSYGSFLM